MTEVPSGSFVYNVKTLRLHTFRSDIPTADLLMDTNDTTGDVLSEGIEDLQIVYCLGDDDPGDLSTYVADLSGQNLASRPVKTARLVLVARSLISDPYKREFSPIAVLNHTAVGSSDSFYRKFLETTVKLRNY
jgi:hypothetical protein